jgi:glycine cleavage system regulatory protein
MRESLVLTVIGDDRPGVVEQLADQILAAGANWEESRMARLAGKFAGILRLSVDGERADALSSRLTTFDPALTVVVERSGDGAERAFRALRLELVGNDRPGIIRDIARTLAQHQVNIEELETDVTSAPMSGDALFRARANLRTPPSVALDTLRSRLEALAGELMVDLTLDDSEQANKANGSPSSTSARSWSLPDFRGGA